ncbi:Rrn11p [Saccharomyces cerevisiae x Saccharomyces kudriavzevii VIN7]|uniref:Rrn11p n=1 Tax=Saccharomyces cerevisiae x Saccharomyces kudriavzevii (strain VIN7) TaxID=1095631 RepID=H0GZ14_SACCK|nr:Rrn11p [Saccharomyces cerevisiae x Saccharomyces kudriavzevii VIN7]
MFEVPITLTNKKFAQRRKLKYQYINHVSRRFDKVAKTTNTTDSLPTPENSAVENNDDDYDYDEDEEQIDEAEVYRRSILQQTKRRRERHWKSVVGELYSSTETESDSQQEEIQENDGRETGRKNGDTDEERIFWKKHEKPEKSFEIWQTASLQNKGPINRRKMTYHKFQKIQKNSLRKMQIPLLHCTKENRLYFRSLSKGLEPLQTPTSTIRNYQTRHIITLTNLLHINVSRHNWSLAYRIFATLIRIPDVQMKSIWGFGVKILDNLPDSSSSLDFLQWMCQIYSSKARFVQNINHRSIVPPFQTGSRTHTAKFATTYLWASLINCQKSIEPSTINDKHYDMENDRLQELIDKISEWVLTPPFMEDAEVWFIYASCHLLKADILSRQFVNDGTKGDLIGLDRDIKINQVIKHIHYVKVFLQTCLDKGGFTIPNRLIEIQLKNFELRLYGETQDVQEREIVDGYDETDISSVENSFGDVYETNAEFLDTQLMDLSPEDTEMAENHHSDEESSE